MIYFVSEGEFVKVGYTGSLTAMGRVTDAAGPPTLPEASDGEDLAWT